MEHVLKYIEKLPTLQLQFLPWMIILHICNQVSKKHYIPVVIGGITGDVQVNDTDYQHPGSYRGKEEKLMLEMLMKDKNKIPSPGRNAMMKMFAESWDETLLKVNHQNAFKRNVITVKLDASEDHLVSNHIKNLVCEEIVEFRNTRTASEAPTKVRDLMKLIKPLEGVRRNCE